MLINKQNNDKLKFLTLFLLQSGIIPLSFLPTSGLFCKEGCYTYALTVIGQKNKILKDVGYYQLFLHISLL